MAARASVTAVEQGHLGSHCVEGLECNLAVGEQAGARSSIFEPNVQATARLSYRDET